MSGSDFILTGACMFTLIRGDFLVSSCVFSYAHLMVFQAFFSKKLEVGDAALTLYENICVILSRCSYACSSLFDSFCCLVFYLLHNCDTGDMCL